MLQLFIFFLFFLDWLVIAVSMYLLALITQALLWGFGIGLLVIIGLGTLLQVFPVSTRKR